VILPIAIYESWTQKTLIVFENDCLRSLLGKRRRDRCRIKDLNQKQNILDKIQEKRLLWFEHVVKRGEESCVYRSYKQEFDGNRPRGRPPKRWSDRVRAELNIPLLTLERRAADRSRWKQSKMREDLI